MGSSASVGDKQATATVTEREQKPKLTSTTKKENKPEPSIKPERHKLQLEIQDKPSAQHRSKPKTELHLQDKPRLDNKDKPICILNDTGKDANNNTTDDDVVTASSEKQNATSKTKPEIKKKRRSQSVESLENYLPDDQLSDIDDDEQFRTVCNELDEVLADHKKFVTSTMLPKEIDGCDDHEDDGGAPLTPTISTVRRSLESEGFENFPGAHLGHTKQTDLIHSYLMNKTLKPNNSLQRLNIEPSTAPPLSPVNIQAGEWHRPESLVQQEEHLKKKEKKKQEKLEKRRKIRDSGFVKPSSGFDASKFAEVNSTPGKNELDIYNKATYSRYKKKSLNPTPIVKQDSVELNPTRMSSLHHEDYSLEYNISEEALLNSIENEFDLL